MISQADVERLAIEFWDYVKGGGHGDGIGHLFINPGVLVPSGELIDLESHQEIHRKLCDELHKWIDLEVTPVCDEPERVRVDGVVQWEASFADGRDGRIKAEVTEHWFIQRCDDGKLRWTHYASPVVRFLPDSAPLEL
ncbi:MAG: hypothetical protein CMJ32_04520 [Phycisphaerae bacterium]|nr:hypothetical protein [Phycisphaerae bacterium]